MAFDAERLVEMWRRMEANSIRRRIKRQAGRYQQNPELSKLADKYYRDMELCADIMENGADGRHLSDCKQEGVCSQTQGCMRHWEERNRELFNENERLRRKLMEAQAKWSTPQRTDCRLGVPQARDGQAEGRPRQL